MENNGKGIFYGVIGVATLIVAIIGATFAFFTAQGGNDASTVTGTTASGVSISLDVSPVFPESTDLQGTSGKMLPLADDLLATALSRSCIEGSGNVACQVYSAQITNDGTAPVNVATQMQLTELGTLVNMKWQVLSGTNAADFATTGTAVTDHSKTSYIEDSENLAGGASTTYYFVVWLSDPDSDQTGTDAKQTFVGTVTANAVNADGTAATKTTATFATQG